MTDLDENHRSTKKTAVITAESLRNRLRGDFRPFRLHLTDGRVFPVPHPDFLSVGRNVAAVITEDDISHTVSLLHVVSIEDADPVDSW